MGWDPKGGCNGMGHWGGDAMGWDPPPLLLPYSPHPLCLLQKVNCVQFNEEATIIVSGENRPLLPPCPSPSILTPPDPPHLGGFQSDPPPPPLF